MTSGPRSPTVCYGALDPPVGGLSILIQSFLENVIAQFDGVWAWNDRRGPNAGQSTYTDAFFRSTLPPRLAILRFRVACAACAIL
jgi:hypothetical protein